MKFLDKHGYCIISTVNPGLNSPQSTLVRYANDDLILYILSAKERRKVTNIGINPKVSMVVYGRSLLIPPSSLIIWGSAKILEEDDKEAVRVFNSKRFPTSWINSQAIKRARKRSKVIFIRVDPERFRLNQFKHGFISGEVMDV